MILAGADHMHEVQRSLREGRTRRPPLHELGSRGGCPYLCVRDNFQKKIVIWAVTVTAPPFGEFGKGPLSETPKLMSPGRSLAILLAASTASLIGST